MQITIHIGYPKTGSSAIQSHIFANRRWFEEQGLFIPRTGYASGLGHAFLAGTRSLPGKYEPGRTDFPDSPNLFKQLAQELKQARKQGFGKALLSWEGFPLLEDSVVRELSKALKKHDVTVLAYVRAQWELYQSATLQQLEGPWRVSARRFFETGEVTTANLSNYDFSSTLSRWKKSFDGSARIRVRVYDKKILVGGNVVLDFLSALELGPDEDFMLEDGPVNHSIDIRAAAMLLVARTTGLGSTERQTLVRALSEVGTMDSVASRNFLHASDIQFFRECFRDSNTTLFSNYRPENIEEGLCGFEDLGQSPEAAQLSPEFEYLRQIHTAMLSPSLETWDGSPLISFKIGTLARPPNRGWRVSENTGVWSLGPVSDIAFLLPQTNRKAGPSAINLVISGEYIGSNTSTNVKVNGRSALMDLRRQELVINIDDDVREHGVRMTLEHQFPETDELKEESAAKPAFKMQYISYRFEW